LLLFRATFQEILSLRADDLLIDRLLKAIKACLCHPKLHLVFLLLAFQPLCGGSTRQSFATRYRLRSNGIAWSSRCRCGGLRKCRYR
jgi:hypothetical protein